MLTFVSPLRPTFVNLMYSSRLQRSSKPVAIWLLVGVGMIMIQVVLGGITRLTGSGLSITEWQPILGAFPPMSEEKWQIAFDKYKEIGQFKHINFDFSLQDFKFIYFWEWLHRLWARLIAVAFVIPFVIFIIQKRFRKDMIIPMIILFLLGALQGAIGWIMVQSGLNENDIHVNHIRLAIHFLAALGLLCYAVWFALKLLIPPTQLVISPGLKKFTTWLLVLLSLQLLYGAFMAGLKAGVVAPTWPTINGYWLPQESGKSWVSDAINVQFIHRGLAYLLTVLTVLWWWKASKLSESGLFNKTRFLPLLTVLIQVLLGIFTIIHSPNPKSLLWLGAAHQFVAMLLLMILVWMFYLLRGKTFGHLP